MSARLSTTEFVLRAALRARLADLRKRIMQIAARERETLLAEVARVERERDSYVDLNVEAHRRIAELEKQLTAARAVARCI